MGGVFGDGVKSEGGTDDLEARSRAAGISVSCVRTVHARLSVPDVHCPFYFLWNLMVLLVNVRPAQTGVREQPDTGIPEKSAGLFCCWLAVELVFGLLGKRNYCFSVWEWVGGLLLLVCFWAVLG